MRERAVEGAVARVMKIGLVLSSAVVAAGLAVQELAIRHLPAGGRELVAGSRPYPRGVPGVVTGLGHQLGPSLLEIGLALLVCTPVAGVLVAAVSYGRVGDRRFALVGGAVLAVLAVSGLVGLGLL